MNAKGKSDYGPADIATTINFTDATLGPTALVKRAHFAELRAAANAVRSAAGLPASTFLDDPLTAGVTTVKLTHLLELRAALDAARAALALPPLTYTDAVPTAGVTRIRHAHVTELRGGVQ